MNYEMFDYMFGQLRFIFINLFCICLVNSWEWV